MGPKIAGGWGIKTYLFRNEVSRRITNSPRRDFIPLQGYSPVLFLGFPNDLLLLIYASGWRETMWSKVLCIQYWASTLKGGPAYCTQLFLASGSLLFLWILLLKDLLRLPQNHFSWLLNVWIYFKVHGKFMNDWDTRVIQNTIKIKDFAWTFLSFTL